MKDTFDVYAWNKKRYLNEDKGRTETDKSIQESPSPKQTAVDWLFNEIDMQYPEINVRRKEWMVDKAKQMEKDQIGDTWVDSRIADKGDDYIGKQKSFEEYYQETYGK